MDAAEQVPLRTGRRVCWLRIVDECSGAVLGPRFSPPGRWSQVPPASTQAQLRLAFGRWGRPERLRVDNGTPWGSARGDLPTDLGLWLTGLGVGMDCNPPATPQDNGVVERSQGTAKRWAEPDACASAEELQQRLEEMDDIQRGEYPSVRRPEPAGSVPGAGSLRSRLHAGAGSGATGAWTRSRGIWLATRGDGEVGASGAISVYNRDSLHRSYHKKKTVI